MNYVFVFKKNIFICGFLNLSELISYLHLKQVKLSFLYSKSDVGFKDTVVNLNQIPWLRGNFRKEVWTGESILKI